MYKVKIAETQEDVDSAYELFSKSFGPSYFDAKLYFDTTRKFDQTLTMQNVFVVKNNQGFIVAAARTVTRTLTILDNVFTIGGIATTVVHPDYHGKGLFDLITRYILEEMKKRKLSFCLVFARRAIDNIYVKHGFWGAPVERKFTLLCPPVFETDEFYFRNISMNDISFLERSHAYTYGQLSFHIDRPRDLWYAIINNPHFRNRYSAYICVKKSDDKEIGYSIAESNKGIIEIATDENNPKLYSQLLFSHKSPLIEEAKKSISLPSDHPAIRALSGEAYSLFTRHPHYGGHVLKILHPQNDTSDLMKLVHRELRKRDAKILSNVNDFDPNTYSRVLTAALFGYEIQETKKYLKIDNDSSWYQLKPIDILFSSLDEF